MNKMVPLERAVAYMLESDESNVDSDCGGMYSKEEESLDDGLMENSIESLETR